MCFSSATVDNGNDCQPAWQIILKKVDRFLGWTQEPPNQKDNIVYNEIKKKRGCERTPTQVRGSSFRN